MACSKPLRYLCTSSARAPSVILYFIVSPHSKCLDGSRRERGREWGKCEPIVWALELFITSQVQNPPPIVLNQQVGTRRRTINSLTARVPVFGGCFPALCVDVRIPELPSHFATPPTVIPYHGRGNKYTHENQV